MFSCNSNSNGSSPSLGSSINEDKTQNTTPSLGSSVNENKNQSTTTSVICGEVPLLNINAYSEYLKFIQSNKLPENFVYFENISQLGVFTSFICLSDSRCGDYSSYMYGFTDGSGYKMSVYIDHDIKEETATNLLLDVNQEDMRFLEKKTRGSFIHEGIEYCYVSGELLSISWDNGGIIYTITGTSMLSKYPLNNSSTTVAKLLKLESSSDTVNSINAPIK